MNSIAKEISPSTMSNWLKSYYGGKELENLLPAWPSVVAQFQNARHILLLTDYDGTLTPIVERPELAVLAEDVRLTLQELASQKRITVGIISGRALKDLKEMVNIGGVIYAGNHGFEIEGQGLNFVNPLADEIKAVLRILRQVLRLAFKSTKGVLVEDKGLTLSVHYRQADEEGSRDVKNVLERVMNGPLTSGKVKVTGGKKVFEVRPAVKWDKGKAVQLLMKRFGKGGRQSSLLPLYLGDDLTDEDAFRFIDRYGKGISVLVGGPNADTSAHYLLESPAEVAQFLKIVLECSKRGFRCEP